MRAKDSCIYLSIFPGKRCGFQENIEDCAHDRGYTWPSFEIFTLLKWLKNEHTRFSILTSASNVSMRKLCPVQTKDNKLSPSVGCTLCVDGEYNASPTRARALGSNLSVSNGSAENRTPTIVYTHTPAPLLTQSLLSRPERSRTHTHGWTCL